MELENQSIQKGIVQGQNAFLLMIGQLYWKLLQ
jgi:hypothetical protein